jgi:hypothetical protein
MITIKGNFEKGRIHKREDFKYLCATETIVSSLSHIDHATNVIYDPGVPDYTSANFAKTHNANVMYDSSNLDTSDNIYELNSIHNDQNILHQRVERVERVERIERVEYVEQVNHNNVENMENMETFKNNGNIWDFKLNQIDTGERLRMSRSISMNDNNNYKNQRGEKTHHYTPKTRSRESRGLTSKRMTGSATRISFKNKSNILSIIGTQKRRRYADKRNTLRLIDRVMRTMHKIMPYNIGTTFNSAIPPIDTKILLQM